MSDRMEKKRILILNGSPRKAKSTTLLATNAFVEGMVQAGGYVPETVHIAELRITPCTGCLSCWGRTEGECVIRNDDIPALKQKILQADELICSFPLYYFGMPGQMKLMMDRLLSLVHAYQGQNAPTDGSPAHGARYTHPWNKMILISGCAYNETELVYRPLLSQCDLVLGKGNYTAILCPQFKTMADNGGTRLARILQRFTAAGEEYVREGALSEQTLNHMTRPPFSGEVYRTILEHVWSGEREKGTKNDTSCH